MAGDGPVPGAAAAAAAAPVAAAPAAAPPKGAVLIHPGTDGVRRPSRGLDAAVAAVLKHEGNRRMLLFALKSVVECVENDASAGGAGGTESSGASAAAAGSAAGGCGSGSGSGAAASLGCIDGLALIDRNAFPTILRIATAPDADGETKALCARLLAAVCRSLAAHPAATDAAGASLAARARHEPSLAAAAAACLASVVETRGNDLNAARAVLDIVGYLAAGGAGDSGAAGSAADFSPLPPALVMPHLSRWLAAAAPDLAAKCAKNSARLRREAELHANLIATAMRLAARVVAAPGAPPQSLTVLARICRGIAALPLTCDAGAAAELLHAIRPAIKQASSDDGETPVAAAAADVSGVASAPIFREKDQQLRVQVQDDVSGILTTLVPLSEVDACLREVRRAVTASDLLNAQTLDALDLFSTLAHATGVRDRLAAQGPAGIDFIADLMSTVVKASRAVPEGSVASVAAAAVDGAQSAAGLNRLSAGFRGAATVADALIRRDARAFCRDNDRLRSLVRVLGASLDYYGNAKNSSDVVVLILALLSSLLAEVPALAETVATACRASLCDIRTTDAGSAVALLDLVRQLVKAGAGRSLGESPLLAQTVRCGSCAWDAANPRPQTAALAVLNALSPLAADTPFATLHPTVKFLATCLMFSRETLAPSANALAGILGGRPQLSSEALDHSSKNPRLFDAVVVALDTLYTEDPADARLIDTLHSVLRRVAAPRDVERSVETLGASFSASKAAGLKLAAQALNGALRASTAPAGGLDPGRSLDTLCSALQRVAAYKSSLPERAQLMAVYLRAIDTHTKSPRLTDQERQQLVKKLLEVAALPNFKLFLERDFRAVAETERGGTPMALLLQASAAAVRPPPAPEGLECARLHVLSLDKLLRLYAGSACPVVPTVLQCLRVCHESQPGATGAQLAQSGALKNLVDLAQRSLDKADFCVVERCVELWHAMVRGESDPEQAVAGLQKAGAAGMLTAALRNWRGSEAGERLCRELKAALAAEDTALSEIEAGFLRLAAAVAAAGGATPEGGALAAATEALESVADALRAGDAAAVHAFERLNGAKQLAVAVTALCKPAKGAAGAGGAGAGMAGFAGAAAGALALAAAQTDPAPLCRYVGAAQCAALLAAADSEAALRDCAAVAARLAQLDGEGFVHAACRKRVHALLAERVAAVLDRRPTVPGPLLAAAFRFFDLCRGDDLCSDCPEFNGLLSRLLAIAAAGSGGGACGDLDPELAARAAAVAAVAGFCHSPAAVAARSAAAARHFERLVLDLQVIEVLHGVVERFGGPHAGKDAPATQVRMVTDAQQAIAALGRSRELRSHCSKVTGVDADVYAKTIKLLAVEEAEAATIGIALGAAAGYRAGTVRLGPHDGGSAATPGGLDFLGIKRADAAAAPRMDAAASALVTVPEDQKVRDLMQQLVDLYERNSHQITIAQPVPPPWVLEYGELLDKLVCFIGPDVALSNEPYAFEHVVPCLKATSTLTSRLFTGKLAPSKQHPPLLPALARIMSTLTTRFVNDPPYGADAVTEGAVESFFELVAGSDRALRTRLFVLHGFGAAARCLKPHDSSRRGIALALLRGRPELAAVPDVAFELAHGTRYGADAEVVAAVLAFLAALAGDKAGELIVQEAKFVAEGGLVTFVRRVESIAECHVGSGAVVAGCVDLIAGLVQRESGAGTVAADFEDDPIHRLRPIAVKSCEGLAALVRYNARALRAAHIAGSPGMAALAAQTAQKDVSDLLEALRQTHASPIEHPTGAADIAASLAMFMEAQSALSTTVKVPPQDLLDRIVAQLEVSASSESLERASVAEVGAAVASGFRVMRRVALEDASLGVHLRTALERLIRGDVGERVHLSADASIELLETAKQLFVADQDRFTAGAADLERCSRAFAALRSILGNIELSWGRYSLEKRGLLRSLVDGLRARLGGVRAGEAAALTLAEVADLWQAHAEELGAAGAAAAAAGPSAADDVFSRHMDFVFAKTLEYGRHTDHAGLETEVAREFCAGLRCMQLLASSDFWAAAAVAQRDLVDLLVLFLEKQTECEADVVQPIVHVWMAYTVERDEVAGGAGAAGGANGGAGGGGDFAEEEGREGSGRQTDGEGGAEEGASRPTGGDAPASGAAAAAAAAASGGGASTISFLSHSSDVPRLTASLINCIGRLQSQGLNAADGPQGFARQALLVERLRLLRHFALFGSTDAAEARALLARSPACVLAPLAGLATDYWRGGRYSLPLLAAAVAAARAVLHASLHGRVVALGLPALTLEMATVAGTASAPALDRRASWPVVVDALFLIGCAAAAPDVRAEYSELDAVLKLLNLLKFTFVALDRAAAGGGEKTGLKQLFTTAARMTRLPTRRRKTLRRGETAGAGGEGGSEDSDGEEGDGGGAGASAAENLRAASGARTTRAASALRAPGPPDASGAAGAFGAPGAADAATLIRDIKRVRMNACLALATLNIGHNANIAIFANNGGIQLTVSLLEAAAGGAAGGAAGAAAPLDDFDYDVGNGAAALLCNSTYRRPDVQEAFGARGACLACVSFLRRYDGSASLSAMRALRATLKAVANLALLPANVDQFVAEGIGETFEYLLGRSAHIDMETFAVILRTLSNLVMEYSKDNMDVFSVALPQLTAAVLLRDAATPTVVALALDVAGALCRLPPNAAFFVADGGVEATLRALRTRAFDAFSVHFGLKLLTRLCIAAPDAGVPEKLRADGLCDFACALLDDAATIPPHVLCSAVRLLLRVTQQSADCAKAFVEAGGLEALLRALAATGGAGGVFGNAFGAGGAGDAGAAAGAGSSLLLGDDDADAAIRSAVGSAAGGSAAGGGAPLLPFSDSGTSRTLLLWLLAAILVKQTGDSETLELLVNKPFLSPKTRRTSLTLKKPLPATLWPASPGPSTAAATSPPPTIADLEVHTFDKGEGAEGGSDGGSDSDRTVATDGEDGAGRRKRRDTAAAGGDIAAPEAVSPAAASRDGDPGAARPVNETARETGGSGGESATGETGEFDADVADARTAADAGGAGDAGGGGDASAAAAASGVGDGFSASSRLASLSSRSGETVSVAGDGSSDGDVESERMSPAVVWEDLGLSSDSLCGLVAQLGGIVREQLRRQGALAESAAASGGRGDGRAARRRSSLRALLSGAAPAPAALLRMNVDLLVAAAALLAFAAADPGVTTAAFIRAAELPVVSLARVILQRAVPAREEVDLMRLLCYTVCHLGAKCEPGELRCALPAVEELAPLLPEAAKIMSQSARSGILLSLMKSLKGPEGVRGALLATDLCLLLHQLLDPEQIANEDEFRAALPLIANIFPLLIARANRCSYPNGVQDVSPRLKQWLRRGGEARGVVVGDELAIAAGNGGVGSGGAKGASGALGAAFSAALGGASGGALGGASGGASGGAARLERIGWRASSDLLKFEWRVGRKGLHANKRMVSSIQCAQLGHCSETLRGLAARYPAQLRPACCCVLLVGGGAGPAAGQAAAAAAAEELCLVFRTGPACKRFYHAVVEWREAACAGMD